MASTNLRLIILKDLEKSPMSGYSLMKQISLDSGGWKPSPGSIYPLLNDMRSKGLVSLKSQGRKKLYSLTEKGSIEFKEMEKGKDEVAGLLLKKYRAFCPDADRTQAISIMQSLQKEDKGSKDMIHDLISLNNYIYLLHKEGKIRSNEKQISRIIRQAIKKLKGVR